MDINIEGFKSNPLPQKVAFFQRFEHEIQNDKISDWKETRKFLQTLIQDRTENIVIRKPAIHLICSLAFLGKLSPSLVVGVLMNIEEDDNVFLLVDQLKYLFFFYEEAPNEISEQLITLTGHDNGDVSSEAKFRLGLIHFFDGHRSNSLDEFLQKMHQARRSFKSAYTEIENRIDALLYMTVVEFLLACLNKDNGLRHEKFITLSNILWSYSIFSIENGVNSFYSKLYEIITFLNNIIGQPLSWLDLRKSFTQLFRLNFELINLQIENNLIQNNLLGLLKGKTIGLIVEPFYRVSLQAKLTAIEERISELNVDEEEAIFLNYIKDLVSAKESKKKDTKAYLIARLSAMFGDVDEKQIVKDVEGLEDDELEFAIFKLFERYKGPSKYKILQSFLEVSGQLQGLHKTILPNEDSRNGFLSNALTNKGFISKDQSKWGASATGKSQGEIDIKIEDANGAAVCIIEGLILKSIDKKNIDLHLKKIFDYDPNGLNRNIIVVYAESKNFVGLWQNYLNYVPTIDFKYPLMNDFSDVSNKYDVGADIKVGLASHMRNSCINNIYHVFINMMVY